MSPTARIVLCAFVLIALLGSLPVSAQGDDICFPDAFFTEVGIYFPFESDRSLSHQWFSLAAQRERTDAFSNDTEVVTVIDAYDLGFRYVLLGTHTNQRSISFDQCFMQALPRPTQEPVCYAEGASRRGPRSFGYAPVQNSVVVEADPALVRVDALWTEIGSTSVPTRIVERIDGRPLLLVEFWNVRLAVDPSVFAIPDLCAGMATTGGSPATRLRQLLGEAFWDRLRRSPPLRRLNLDADPEAAGAGVP